MFPDNQMLEELYQLARIEQIDKPHITPDDVTNYLADPVLSFPNLFRSNVVGYSYLGREIIDITVGKGPTAILFWSQMHGDEPTATSALLDLISFLQQNKNQPWLEAILDNVTLHIVPMLNPDGAAMKTRENAQGIDINRDASILQTPEGQALKLLFDNIKPKFAFNLHDQSKYYRIEHSSKPVKMAFLAPAGDSHESMPQQRCNAMKLIGAILSNLDNELSGKVAKYQDGYSDRAFGDLATSSGIACVLIESGSSFNDENRQQARRLNFMCLLHGIFHIAKQTYTEVSEFAYNSLPLNIENGLCDTLIRGLQIGSTKGNFYVDVAIKLESLKYAFISELGDLRQLGAYQVLNADDLYYASGNAFEVTEPIDLSEEKYLSLLKRGYCRFSGEISLINQLTDWPIVKGIGEPEPAGFWLKKISPTWLMLKDGQVEAALLEGHLVIVG